MPCPDIFYASYQPTHWTTLAALATLEALRDAGDAQTLEAICATCVTCGVDAVLENAQGTVCGVVFASGSYRLS